MQHSRISPPPSTLPTEASSREIFLKWASEHKHIEIHSGIDLFHEFRQGYRGVIAREDIPLGTVLMRIPRSQCIGALTEDETQEEWKKVIEKNDADGVEQKSGAGSSCGTVKLSKACFTVLRLLHEMGKGEQSEFAAYIGILPTNSRIPLQWNDAEKALLRGTSAENIDAQCDDLGRQFAVFEALRTQHPGLWQGISSEEEGEEGRQAAFAQAVNWVRSRGFTVGGEPLLLPAFDMLNHDPHRAGATFLQEEEGNGDSDGTGEVFKLVATRPLVANEEIFRSFGPLSNAMLLESYGFILEDNVFDRVIIPRHMVEHCLKQQEQTKQLVGKTTDSQSVDESDSTTQVFHMANKKNTGQGYILSKYNPVSEDLVADVQHHLDTVDLERVYQVVWNVLGAKEASYAKANKETNCCASVGTDALQIVHWLVQQEKSVLHRARQQIEEQGFFFDTSSCFNDSPRKANPEDDSSNKRPKIC